MDRCICWSKFAKRHPAKSAGSAAETAAKSKRLKYSALEATYDFLPVAVETAGPWGREARELFRELGKRLREKGNDPHSESWLVQHVSIAIQRGNAASLMGTFGLAWLRTGFSFLSCSQCDFTTNFESALIMHQQLHHEDPTREVFNPCEMKKSHTLPGTSTSTFIHAKPSKEFKLPARTSSATRLFDKLRARIGRGRTLFSHPEDAAEDNTDMCILSECTSKAFKEDLPLTVTRSDFAGHERLQRETFRCHLCNFEADRITVLDRHLLNDHKLGIDNLLKLVIAKTKDALSEETNTDPFRRQPYYKPQEMEYQLQEGEFMETVAPRIRVMKHMATNTEDTGLTDNFKLITSELEKIVTCRTESHDQSDLFQKMQTLNEYMCKFVDSSNMLKKVLTKELDTKSRSDRTEHRAEPVFDLRLGDTPRDW